MTQIITLALDGEAVPLKDMTVTISMQFQEKDQSGQSSSTARSEQGIKAKEMRISGLVPFSKPEVLRRIFELGSATSDSGKLKVYRVANMTASAVNFREATFSGQIEAPQQDGKMAWMVSFTLREYVSVPEKKQARANSKQTAKAQGQNGQSQVTSSADDEQRMSWFERKVLKPTDALLGNVMGGNDATG